MDIPFLESYNNNGNILSSIHSGINMNVFVQISQIKQHQKEFFFSPQGVMVHFHGFHTPI